MWTVFYARAGERRRLADMDSYLAPSLENALTLAKTLVDRGYVVHEIHGDEGTRLPRSLIEERLKTL
jgi:hypothetical protein